MTDSESDIEIKSAPLNKHVKPASSPSDVINNNLKKTSTKMMIIDALTELKSRKGVSLQAIKKHLTEKFQVNTEKVNYLIKKSLKSGVEDGTFVQLKGIGASGSFKLAAVKEKAKKPKKKKETNPEKSAKEAKKSAGISKKVLGTPPKKPKITKKKMMEKKEISPTKKKVEVKGTKKSKKEVEPGIEKKTKVKKAVDVKTPGKKRKIVLKRKSSGNIIKPPKMKPKRS